MEEDLNFVDSGVESIYISSISVDDLPIADMSFIGMRLCGAGCMITIGVLVILRILRNL